MAHTRTAKPDERRRHWRDRRGGMDRRNPTRIIHDAYDCRSGIPRRESEIAGELDDGEVWWDEQDDLNNIERFS